MEVKKFQPLAVLPLENDISAVQKCYLPIVYSDILKECKVGCCLLLQISSTTKCLCKLYWKRDLHSAFCHIDQSVMTSSACDRTLMGLPRDAANWTCSNLSLEHIQVLPCCIAIRDLRISVVFESVSNNKRWQKDTNTLQDIVKDVLKVFILIKDSIVYTRNLSECQKFGIHCIVIHDIGELQLGSDTTAGRVTSGTKVSVVRRMSRKWLDQLQNCGSEIPLGGLDGPYRTLQDIICQQKLYQQATEHLGLRPCQQVRAEIS